MTDQTLRKALYRSAVQTFEDLTFMLAEPEQDDSPGGPLDLMASITFKGPFAGRVMVAASGDFLGTVAANMLGEDGPVSDQHRLDMLAEIANVICGNLLPAVAGEEEVFHFEAPIVFESNAIPFDESEAPAAQTTVAFDEGRADVTLFVDKSCLN